MAGGDDEVDNEMVERMMDEEQVDDSTARQLSAADAAPVAAVSKPADVLRRRAPAGDGRPVVGDSGPMAGAAVEMMASLN